MRAGDLEANVNHIIDMMGKGLITQRLADAAFADIEESDATFSDFQVFRLFNFSLDRNCPIVTQKTCSFVDSEARWLHCFIYAIQVDNKDAIAALKETREKQGYNLNAFGNSLSPLFAAVKTSNLELLFWLENNRADFCIAHPENGQTALHIACQFSQPEVVNFLLQRNVPICCYDRTNQSPLIYALDANKLDIARILIKEGAGLYERFSKRHEEALKALNFFFDYYLGATLADKFLTDKHPLFEAHKGKEESENVVDNKKFADRLSEVLRSNRKNMQALKLFETHEDGTPTLQTLALSTILNNIPKFNIRDVKETFKIISFNFGEGKRLTAIQNLQDRIALINEIIELLQVTMDANAEAINHRFRKKCRLTLVATQAALFPLLLLACIYFFMTMGEMTINPETGEHICAQKCNVPKFVLGMFDALLVLPANVVFLIFTIYKVCTSAAFPSLSNEYLTKKVQNKNSNELPKWDGYKNKLLALGEIILTEAADRVPQELANQLRHSLNANNLTQIILKNILSGLRDYYVNLLSTLQNTTNSEIPFIEPIKKIIARAKSIKQKVSQLFQEFKPAVEDTEGAPLFKIENTNHI